MAERIKRDRVRFTCPNCDTIAYARPANRLICGTCCLPMEAQIPESYPKAVEVQKLPFTNIPPAELPLETLALPPHVRELIGGRPTETPNGADDPAEEAGRPVAPTAVLETPELAEQTPEIQRNKRPRELSESQLATADQYIAKCLQLEAEGNKVRGWKSRLAKSIDRHGAWVTKRIKHVQAQGQQVAA